MNVGSRFYRAGFTGTRGVLVSAVPSAGIGGPASMLGFLILSQIAVLLRRLDRSQLFDTL
jgi:hypothetical protein